MIFRVEFVRCVWESGKCAALEFLNRNFIPNFEHILGEWKFIHFLG